MGRNSRKKKQQRRKAALARVRKTTPEARRKPVPVMYTGWYGFGDPPGEDGLFDDCPVCEKMRELGYSGPFPRSPTRITSSRSERPGAPTRWTSTRSRRLTSRPLPPRSASAECSIEAFRLA